MAQAENFASTEGKRARMMNTFAAAVYELFLEELFIRQPELLGNNVGFYQNSDSLCCAIWSGPPWPIGDSKKLAGAQKTRLEARVTTLEYECAHYGLDYKSVAIQRAKEKRQIEALEQKPKSADNTDE